MSASSLLCDNLAKDTKVPSPTCCHFLDILHTRKRPQSFLKLLKWLPQNLWLMLLLKCVISSRVTSVARRDGTWQKCGHSSPNGWVSLISVDTGKVSDVEGLSSKCRAYELRCKLSTASLKWKAGCKNCPANRVPWKQSAYVTCLRGQKQRGNSSTCSFMVMAIPKVMLQ